MPKGVLKIEKSEIVVSKHRDGSVYFHHKVYAVLPGCRKATQLSITPFALRLVARPLFGYNGTATIDPEQWSGVIRSAPVVSDSLFPVEITPEIVSQARDALLDITTCPAVTDTRDVSPSFKPSFDTIVFGFSGR